MTEAPGLRELKKSETRKAISQAALQLIDGRSYADVTVAEIATAAGVSRRTVSNYFASKADCFAGAVGGAFFTEIVGEVLAPESGSTTERLRRAFKAVDHSYWENVRRLHTVARAEPEVAAAVAFAERSQCDELADALVEASDNQIDRLRLHVSVAAISSCITVTVEHWLDSGAQGGPAALADLVASSFDILDLTWLDPYLDLIRSVHDRSTA